MRSMRRKVQSCEQCQRHSLRLPKEIGKPTEMDTLFSRISMDAVHIKAGKFKYLIVAWDNLSRMGRGSSTFQPNGGKS